MKNLSLENIARACSSELKMQEETKQGKLPARSLTPGK